MRAARRRNSRPTYATKRRSSMSLEKLSSHMVHGNPHYCMRCRLPSFHEAHLCQGHEDRSCKIAKDSRIWVFRWQVYTAQSLTDMR